MMTAYDASVSLVDGQAHVTIGNNRFIVSARESTKDSYNCPVELVIGALGS